MPASLFSSAISSPLQRRRPWVQARGNLEAGNQGMRARQSQRSAWQKVAGKEFQFRQAKLF